MERLFHKVTILLCPNCNVYATRENVNSGLVAQLSSSLTRCSKCSALICRHLEGVTYGRCPACPVDRKPR